MSRVVWTLQAIEDVEAIRAYIARDSRHFADLFAERIIAAVDRLAIHPESGRVVPEFGRSDLREVVLSAYRIVYRLAGDDVAILSVFHAARLLGPLPGIGA